MLDPAIPRNTIVAAALQLAAEQSWERLTLADVAESAGLTLLQLKNEFASKGEILAAFTGAVDDEVLARAPRRAVGQSARDALFEVIMCRFDVLAPFKEGLRSIANSAMPEPAQIAPLLASQRWMLEAAGVAGAGFEGTLRAAGLATVYSSAFRTWLEDDDPGHARTMAALDRRLRRGERAIIQIEAVCATLTRFASAAMPRGFRMPSRTGAAERDAPERTSSPGAGPSL